MKDYKEQIKNNFGSHAVNKDRAIIMDAIRSACYMLAEQIIDDVPDGREKSIALTKLEEVMFWANAGIARE